jgi:hypothetical protein
MMRTELIGVKLPLHEAVLVRRGAAELGLSKSAFAANLIVRGLEAGTVDKLPALVDQFRIVVAELKEVTNRVTQLDAVRRPSSGKANNDELRAFMIEALVLLRYLTKHDLALGSEIGRKLQRSVGNVRVEGT